MTMYKGNSATASINMGGTEIGQIYKGNELIWSKTEAVRLPLYSYDGLYIMGECSTIGMCANDIHSTGILEINGSLGEENSQIITQNINLKLTLLYWFTQSYGSVRVFVYCPINDVSQGNRINYIFYVLENSKIGDKMLYRMNSSSNRRSDSDLLLTIYPDPIDENSMTVYRPYATTSMRSYTYNRTSQDDCVWTYSGLV